MENVSFDKVWGLLRPVGEFCRRQRACERLWGSFNAERQQLIYSVLQAKLNQGHYVSPNPYYAIDDNDQPVFLSGVEQDKAHAAGIPIVMVRHRGKYIVCTRQTMLAYGLEYVREA